MPEIEAKDRKFKALFDGDEIDGKRYPLDGGVTKLDAFTAGYLLQTGRIEEVDDDTFANLPGPYAENETAADRDGSKAGDGESDEDRAAREALELRLDAAKAAFENGKIPDDLINPDAAADAPDRLITAAKLKEIADAEGATATGAKANFAIAIMAKRAEAAGE